MRVDGVTHDGLVMGKHLSRAKFLSSLEHGSAVSDIAFGLDLGGTPYLAWWDEWRSVGLSDALQIPDPTTLALVANRPGTAMVFATHRLIDGSEHPVCPRALLGRVQQRLADDGLTSMAAFELEFMAFEESFPTAAPQGLPRASHPSACRPHCRTCPTTRIARRELMDEVLRRFDHAWLPWEGWNNEAAPGQIEVNFPPAPAVTACDRLVRARALIRETAVDLGMSVTYMAKPSPDYGNGAHVHHSIWRGEHEPDGRSGRA